MKFSRLLIYWGSKEITREVTITPGGDGAVKTENVTTEEVMNHHAEGLTINHFTGKGRAPPLTAHSVRHDGHSSRFRPFLAGSDLLTGNRPVTHPFR
jgi:hypothetical protein